MEKILYYDFLKHSVYLYLLPQAMIINILKWVIGTLITLLTLLILGLIVTDHTYILRGIRVTYFTGHSTAFLEDYHYFENRTIKTTTPEPWPKANDYNTVESTAVLDSLHTVNGSVAYLVIKNDSLWFEKYYDGYTEKSLSNSFSMAKSITAAILGKALELGYIKNLEEKVKDYLPDLQGPYADEVTVRDLVTMRSGLQWDEKYYSPFSITTKAYFYNDISKAMLELPIINKPNEVFRYQSGDTQLLGMVLSKALPMTLTEFLSEYFWQPMGAEQDALWQISSNDGMEKTYCCIASNARDFARFGKLYAQSGRWKDKQLLDSAYIQQSIQPAADNSPDYGYSWWVSTFDGKKVFSMNGHLGQFVIAIPEDNLIIVRLGHKTDKLGIHNPQGAYYKYIEQTYILLQK